MRIATPDDEPRAIDAQVTAFAEDPISKWCYPDPASYQAAAGDFFRAYGGDVFKHETVCCTNNHESVSLWLPPNVHPDEKAVGAIIEQTVEELIRGKVYEVFGKLGAFHPEEPH